MRYFNVVFGLQQAYPTEGVIAYAVGRLRPVSVDRKQWSVFQNLLYQCALAEPASLAHVLGLLARHLDLGIAPELGTVLNKIVQVHTGLGHGSEVAWAVWGATHFGIGLSAASAKALSRSLDPVVALSALHARQRGTFRGELNVSTWQTALTREDLYGHNWILTYEALRHGWLTPPASGDPCIADPNFAPLRDEDVSFYDPDAGLVHEEEHEEQDYDEEDWDLGQIAGY